MLWAVLGLVVVAGAAVGPVMSNVEQAKYSVASAHGAIEIRDYDAMIVAEATVAGDREKAIGEGFGIIADYIFGNNIAAQNVAMTAPVMQQPSEAIAMTAPVTQQGENGSWKVRFVMPASYSLTTLPKPQNSAVVLKEVPAKRFAAIRFSGMAGAESLQEKTAQLEAFLVEQKLQAVSVPTYAFFNPPWTLPFLRRNEVMVEIAP